MKNSLLFLLILCIALNSCEKENLEPIILEYIIAGDTLQSEYIAFNDTITGLKDIDFNSDDQLDFSLLPSYSAHCASEVWNLSAYLLTYSNFEVIIDSLIVVGAKTDTIISPRILSEGDRIDKSSDWIEILDNELVLSTEYIIDSMCYQVGVVSFSGWLDNDNGYMGFRTYIDTDTIYGWMKLKVAYWSSHNPITIVLEDICYR